MKITIPYPPSLNRYWRTFRGRVYLSKEAKEFKEEVAKIFYLGNYKTIPNGPVSLKISVYRPRKIGDLDNTLKGILDSLIGLAYGDDRQVVEIHAKRFDDKSNPRVEVQWEEA